MLDPDRWHLLEPLLNEALELDSGARAPWLVELSSRSPELAAELASLLARDAAADRSGFLAGRAAEPGLAGLELGAYRLVRPLGHGGMGTVWLARRSDGRFEGWAAVKILNLALLTAPGQERFRREGSVLARLNHSGIARLLDAGVGDSGQPFLVLEHVEGLPIDQFAREHRLFVADTVRLFLQVLAAVEHAHAHLIVHRDLKPSNILVTADGTVKLLDFGIAKLLDGDTGGDRSDLTLEGGQVFTPRFAAPEQVRGTTLTTATDVYALGVLLYLLLTGRHPTAGEDASPADAMRTLLEVEPARPGLGDLDTILALALRKEPAERYRTVAAFGEDLQRYLRHEPVSARRQSLGYLARTFVRRHRAGVLAAAVAVLGLLGATVFSVAQMREAKRQRDVAVEERRRADAQIEFQGLLLSEVGDAPMTMRQLLDSGRVMLERHTAQDPRLRTSLLLQLAGSYAELGDVRTRAGLLVRAESLARAGRRTDQMAVARCQMADNLRMQGEYDDAWRTLAGADSLLAAARDPRSDVQCLL
ncbi:MAG: serine/threonine-protein kinase, partial [Gemmatimonadales bacterium]